MENARVVVIEDNPIPRRIVRAALETNGHQIVAEAASMEQAMEVIGRLAINELEADVILLDGNLDSNKVDYSDARQIMAELKQANIGAAVLGFSGELLKDINPPIDVIEDTAKNPAMVLLRIANL
jgi:CheY-like chemotaxis protein